MMIIISIFIPLEMANFHYTCHITSKLATSCGAHLSSLAPGQHSSEEMSQQRRDIGDTVPI